MVICFESVVSNKQSARTQMITCLNVLSYPKARSTLAMGFSQGEKRSAPAYYSGAVAQLGERRVRNAKVGSSILLGSTNIKPR